MAILSGYVSGALNLVYASPMMGPMLRSSDKFKNKMVHKPPCIDLNHESSETG
eukprot:m.42250 g.42250  ORF g.42250 m.42250 type:complete len:53 (+) comp10664_c0_seq2:609-767(+)